MKYECDVDRLLDAIINLNLDGENMQDIIRKILKALARHENLIIDLNERIDSIEEDND